MAEAAPPPAARPPSIVLLTALAAFGPVSTDLYLPSLPDMARAFGASVAQVQLTLSAFIGGFAVCQLVYGPLSDRFGRRPVLLAGVLTYVAASVVCLLAPTIEMLIFGRFLQAVGACAGPVVARAMVRDLFPRDQAARVLSYMASAMALAPAVAPILGGWVHEAFGWRANFVLLCLFGVGLAVAAALFLRETNTRRDPLATRVANMAAAYGLLLSSRHFLGHTLTVGFAFAAMFAFISGGSFALIDVLGVAPRHFGFGFAAVVAGYITGTFASGRLGPRLGLARLMAVGVALGCVAGAALLGFAVTGMVSLGTVIAPISVVFLAAGLVLPNGTAAAISPYPHMAGSASALLGCLQMGVAAAVGVGVGHLFDGTIVPMAAMIAAMGAAALAAYWGLARGRKGC